MSRLERILAALQHSLGLQKPLREKARRRMLSRHEDQAMFERQQRQAEKDAKAARKQAHKLLKPGPHQNQKRGAELIAKAQRLDKKALTLEGRATRQRQKALVWKTRARVFTQRIHKIETSIAAAEKELAELGPHVDYDKQKCTGGSFAERWVASNVASWHRFEEGIREGRYSQEGIANIHLPYGPGPHDGRDDCSSYGRSQCLATDADDPSGHDFGPEGFTGDMAEAHGRWKEVSKAQMMRAGAGFIIYGSGSGHHIECFAPTKSEPERTIGHGSAPVDPGTIHLFGPNEVERYFVFLGN